MRGMPCKCLLPFGFYLCRWIFLMNQPLSNAFHSSSSFHNLIELKACLRISDNQRPEFVAFPAEQYKKIARRIIRGHQDHYRFEEIFKQRNKENKLDLPTS